MPFNYDPAIRVILNPVSKDKGDKDKAASYIGVAKRMVALNGDAIARKGREHLKLPGGGYIDIRFFGNIININIDIPGGKQDKLITQVELIVQDTDDTFYFLDCKDGFTEATDEILSIIAPTQDTYESNDGVEWVKYKGDIIDTTIVSGYNEIFWNGIKISHTYTQVGEAADLDGTIFILTKSDVYIGDVTGLINETSGWTNLVSHTIPDGWLLSGDWVWNESSNRVSCIMTKTFSGGKYHGLFHFDVTPDGQGGWNYSYDSDDLSAEYSGCIKRTNYEPSFTYEWSGQVVEIDAWQSSSPCNPSYIPLGWTINTVNIKHCLSADNDHYLIVDRYFSEEVPDFCEDKSGPFSYRCYGYEITESVQVYRIAQYFTGKSLARIEYNGDSLVYVTYEALAGQWTHSVTADLVTVRAFGTDGTSGCDGLPAITSFNGTGSDTGGWSGYEIYRTYRGSKTKIGEAKDYRCTESWSHDIPEGWRGVTNEEARIPVARNGTYLNAYLGVFPTSYNFKHNIGNTLHQEDSWTIADTNSVMYFNNNCYVGPSPLTYTLGPNTIALNGGPTNNAYLFPCMIEEHDESPSYSLIGTAAISACYKFTYDPVTGNGFAYDYLENPNWWRLEVEPGYPAQLVICNKRPTVALDEWSDGYGYKGTIEVTLDGNGDPIKIK